MRHLIIGGGIAGTTTAEELRKRDPSAHITLVCEEHDPLYSRVLLPHYLKGKVSRDRVFLKKESWYGQQRIEWLHGTRASHLDARNKFVGLSDGREMSYDKLLIAMGGEPRLLDEEPHGVSHLRTLADADHLLELIAQARVKRGGIYGSGFIACEYINLFAHFGIPTVLAHRGTHFFSRALMPEAGELIARHLADHGVETHAQTQLLSLEGGHELTGFKTRKGEHACEVLGVGIGIVPDFEWLRAGGVETGVGVKGNEYLETNVPDIYVAGDVAEFFDPVTGRQLVMGNWMNAMSQGRVVARTMGGERTRFELVSSYATNVLGLELIFVGDTDKAAAQEIRVLGSVEEKGVTQIFERDGRVVGGVMIGRNSDRAGVTRAIQARVGWRQH